MKDAVIILPTYNEAENLRVLIPQLKHHNVDILVSDDSPNYETQDVAKRLGATVLRRTGKRGLIPAILDGIAATAHKYVIVMDADLQHPAETVPDIIEALKRSEVVVASRLVSGGSQGGFSLKRKVISAVANLLSLPLAPKVKDRMSGFIAFRRDVLDGIKPEGQGFKFGLGILVKGNYKTVEEVPYTFQTRSIGESKLSSTIMLEYLKQLVRLYLHKFKILRFALVGASGAVVKLGTLYLLTDVVGMHYMVSYAIAFGLSVSTNYLLNSIWTFQQREGLSGWMRYATVSSFTLTINAALLHVLTEWAGLWYMFSAAVGVLSAFLINYTTSKRWVWKRRASS